MQSLSTRFSSALSFTHSLTDLTNKPYARVAFMQSLLGATVAPQIESCLTTFKLWMLVKSNRRRWWRRRRLGLQQHRPLNEVQQVAVEQRRDFVMRAVACIHRHDLRQQAPAVQGSSVGQKRSHTQAPSQQRLYIEHAPARWRTAPPALGPSPGHCSAGPSAPAHHTGRQAERHMSAMESHQAAQACLG